jgi:peptide/nickel transport system substrate-binding protein
VDEHRRGGTVTFVFTDIEGSTRLVQEFKDRWPEVRSAHRRIVRSAFEAHGGDEVDTQGDSFFYVFGRARDAALAAAEAQRGLAEHEWPEGGEVRIRIGMHTGEPVVSEEGYHGVGVHRAARIMASGHGGQVLLSEATTAVLRDEEVAGVSVRDLGVHRLKDLDRPEHVYQLVADGLEPVFPKIRTPGEEKPYYRRPLVIGAAAGVLAAAVAIPVFAFADGSGGGSPLKGVQDNAVGVVDESDNTLDAEATGVDEPHGAAAGAGAIWVTSGGGSVAKIDPQTRRVEQTIDIGDGPEGVAVNGPDVWIANSLDGTVSRVSADTNHESESYKVGNTPTGVAVGHGSVWVTNAGDGTVTQLNANTGETRNTIDLHAPVRGIAYGGGSLWVTDPVGNAVIRVPVTSPSSTRRIDVGSGPSAIAYGGGKVWVANSLAGTVSRIDPETNTMTGMFPVGAAPGGIAVTPHAVWVSDEVEGRLARVDPKTGSVAKRIRLRGRPQGVAAADGSVWVGVQAAGAAHSGGNLRLLTPVFDYIDPALAYFISTWDSVSVTHDGLVGFKRVGGVDGNTLVPDLATSLPRPSDNGLTYTFQLRRGIRFSNGKEVTLADVRASFERIFRAYGFQEAQKDEHGRLLRDKHGKLLKLRDTSPAADNGYYSGIIRAEACVKHPMRCDLSRGIVTSDTDRTVTFHLVAPDPEFLYKLATPFGAIVPRGTPVGGTQKIPGTGPYKVETFVPHRYVRLVRNPHFHVWWGPAQPAGLPDTIELGTNLAKGKGDALDPRKAFLATAAGHADYTAAGVPQELLATARTRYPAQLHVTPAPSTNWVLVNTRKPPFDNVHARRALAFALDRGRMVGNSGGPDLATATCQILPPGLAGYRPYCPFTAGPEYAPDLGRAQAELQKSGTHGARVRVVTTDQTLGVNRQNLEVAATLRRLGYRVTVKHYAADPGYFSAAFGPGSRNIDAVVLGWIQDYPAPSNFFAGINCPPASPYMCSKAYSRNLARTAAAATASGSSDPWTAFDRKVTDSAVVIPFLNLKAIDFVSKRLGNYQHHPEFDLLIDQVWVQ